MKIVAIVIVTFCCVNLLPAQESANTKFNNIKAVYRLSYQYDSTDATKRSTEEMILYASSTTSKFASANHLLYTDSLKFILAEMFERTGKIDGTLVPIPNTRFKFEIFKANEKIIVFDDVSAQEYRYEEPKNNVKWKIYGERKMISGYNCQRAQGTFSGRRYTAWFAPEIPLAEGPYKFSGLPGLIVKISDDKGHYDFELKGLKRNVNYAVEKMPKSYVSSTKNKVFEMEEARRQNPIQSLNQIATLNLSPDDIKRITEREKRRNNPIELKTE